MADKYDGVDRLSVNVLYKFLSDTRWGDNECEVCSAKQWAVRSAGDHPALLEVGHGVDEPSQSQFFSVICESCGNVKLIDSGFVADYVMREDGDGNE